jgi:hypothetical protein
LAPILGRLRLGGRVVAPANVGDRLSYRRPALATGAELESRDHLLALFRRSFALDVDDAGARKLSPSLDRVDRSATATGSGRHRGRKPTGLVRW